MFHFIFDEHLSIALDAWSLAKSLRLMLLPQVVVIHRPYDCCDFHVTLLCNTSRFRLLWDCQIWSVKLYSNASLRYENIRECVSYGAYSNNMIFIADSLLSCILIVTKIITFWLHIV